MTEQCRNARLDSHTFGCRHVFSHSVADLVFCPGDHLFFFFGSFPTKWKTISLCQTLADWTMSTASVWFPPSDWFFFEWPVNYKSLFVSFWFFVFLFLWIGLHPAEHCWTSNDILDWCFVTLDQVTYGPHVETSLPTKDDWNLWDANKVCLHARSADTPVTPHNSQLSVPRNWIIEPVGSFVASLCWIELICM